MILIKNVKLLGFKSYANQTFDLSADQFSAGLNLIIGSNGSGKSNFFEAIEHIVNPQLYRLTQEQRMRLLHEGAGKQVIAASIEITFDNKSGALIVEEEGTQPEEVTIKRFLGMKKDEFRVNTKPASPTEVQNLLESVCISSSNPFNIVRQMGVQEMANMSQERRLGVLKTAAGIEQYETARKESDKHLAETNTQIAHLERDVKHMTESMAKLAKDKDQFDEWAGFDRTRRAIMHTQSNRQLSLLREELRRIDESDRGGNEAGVDTETRRTYAEELRKLRGEAQAADKPQDSRRVALARTLQEMEAQKEKLQLQSNELETRLESNPEGTLKLEIEKVQNKVDATKKELQAREDNLNAKNEEMKKNHSDCVRSSAIVDELRAVTGRRFAKKDERDAYLNNEINKNRATLDRAKAQLNDITKDLSAGSRKEIDDEVAAKRKERDDAVQRIRGAEARLAELAAQRDKLLELRRTHFQLVHNAERRVQEVRQERERVERKFRRAVPGEVAQGLQALEAVLEKEPALKPLVYGPLVRLMEVDRLYQTAVEVTGGTSLLNIVVENSDVAKRVLHVMNQEKREGRISFMPLASMATRKSNDKDIIDSECKSLLSFIKFDEKFLPAFNDVFGGTLLVKDILTARPFTKKYSCNCINLDGDKVERKGAMIGGYIDRSISRIGADREMRHVEGEIQAADENLRKAQKEAGDVDTQLKEKETEIAQLTTVAASEHSVADIAQRAFFAAQGRAATLDQSMADKQRSANLIRMTIEELEAVVSGLQKDLATPFVEGAKLTAEQEATLVVEAKRVEDLKKTLSKNREDIEQLTTMVSSLRSGLNDNYLKTLADLYTKHQRLLAQDLQGQHKNVNDQLARTEKAIADVTQKLKELDESTKQGGEKTKRINELQKLIAQLDEKLRKVHSELEDISGNRAHKLNQIQQAEAAMREIGPVPDNLDVYVRYDEAKLDRELKGTTKALKSFTTLNKAAAQQYSKTREERDALQKKLEKAYGERSAISDLMAQLEQKKDELVHLTFQQVSTEFNKAFQYLYPTGTGRLRLVRDRGFTQTQGDMTQTQSQVPQSTQDASVNALGGVAVDVDVGNGIVPMEGLSGGQKSSVALALILGIQKTDPRPFYVLDEVDEALDPAVRQRLANLLAENAQHTQYLCSSFHTEMHAVAKKHYAVTFSNKVSKVVCTDKTETLKILTAAAAAGGAAGPASMDDDEM